MKDNPLLRYKVNKRPAEPSYCGSIPSEHCFCFAIEVKEPDFTVPKSNLEVMRVVVNGVNNDQTDFLDFITIYAATEVVPDMQPEKDAADHDNRIRRMNKEPEARPRDSQCDWDPMLRIHV